MKEQGQAVTADTIALIESELKAEITSPSSGAPPDEQNVFLEFLGRRKTHKRHNAHREHKPSDETDLLISTINGMDLGWKADVCKYQKHHEKYGDHCDKPVMLAQTSEDELL